MERSGLGDRSRSSLGQKPLPRTRPRLMLSVLSQGERNPICFQSFLEVPRGETQGVSRLGQNPSTSHLYTLRPEFEGKGDTCCGKDQVRGAVFSFEEGGGSIVLDPELKHDVLKGCAKPSPQTALSPCSSTSNRISRGTPIKKCPPSLPSTISPPLRDSSLD